jgi:hypothetical protein
MRLVDALKDARSFQVLDPASARFTTGTPEEQAQERGDWHRHQRIRQQTCPGPSS